MEVLLFAVVVGIISEVLWHNFSRAGKKQLTKYDKEHSTVTVLGTDELVSKLNESKGLGICDIKPDTNKVEFNCNIMGVVDKFLLDVLEVKFLWQK